MNRPPDHGQRLQSMLAGNPPDPSTETEVAAWTAGYYPGDGGAYATLDDHNRATYSKFAALHAQAEAGHEQALHFTVLRGNGSVYGTFHWCAEGWRWS